MKQFPVITSETERITLKEMSIRDESRYVRFLREGEAYLKARYGDEMTDERSDESDALGHRARILASLSRYEVRNGDGEWHVAELPKEYAAADTFADAFPRELYARCGLAALQLNWPQYLADPDEKKGPTTIVEWLTD